MIRVPLRIVSVCLVLLISLALPFVLSGQSGVTYVYDDLGRLVAVIDPSGNAAGYSYDAVGNLLGITRHTSTQISALNFSPTTGPVVTTVTITGSGFSTTLSSNTVKFNGTTATVTSATTNQLVTTVPSGATTGTISVTSPNGTATTATSFTVTASSGVPTITSFSPTSGVANASVSLTGTNFDTTAVGNNKLRLNLGQGVVNTVTSSTAMTGTVPGGSASGHFSVLTSKGKGTSTQDFYVPFGSHVASDIGFTARMNLGASQTVTLGTASKIALVLFDTAFTGQSVSLQLSGSTFSTCTLYLIAPDNTSVTSSSCTSSTTVVNSTTLARLGTYTIGIDPGTSTGSLTIGLTPDAVGTITIDGPTVTATTTAVGQDAHLNFTALAGQRIVVTATSVTTNPYALLNVVRPDGTVQAFGDLADYLGNAFIDTQTLASTGTYQLWVQHNSTSVGTQTLQINSVPADFTATLAVSSTAGATGTAVRVPTTGNLAAGQNGNLTFSGTSGQMLSFNVSNPTFGTSSLNCVVTVKDPSNSQIATGNCGTGAASVIDTVALSSTGTYTLLIDPHYAYTGSVSLSINNAADATGTITVGGSAVTATTSVPGQDARLSFTGTASQRIAVFATSVTNPYAYLNLQKPDGTTQAWIGISTGSTSFLDTKTLATAGTYQLWTQHSGTGTGSETLQIVTVPADISASITVGGSAYSFTTSAGQNANITFSNPSSQSVTLHWTSSTYPSSPGCTLTVTGPSPSTSYITSTYCTSASGTLGLGTLASGTYNILIDPQAQSTGGISLSVTTP